VANERQGNDRHSQVPRDRERNAFTPDQETQGALAEAIHEAHAWLDSQYEAAYSPPFYEGTGWALPISRELAEGMQTLFANPDEYPLDSRAVAYHFAFFSAKHYGTVQFYLFTIRDGQSQAFDGANSYRLTVPANAPVSLYWSVTIYDRTTHTLIRDLPWSSRSSNTPALQKNTDGSIDILFGPDAPQEREQNWIPTKPGHAFEALFRFYGPEQPLFDKTWRLPDIEKNT
jgi:hypothetical protein